MPKLKNSNREVGTVEKGALLYCRIRTLVHKIINFWNAYNGTKSVFQIHTNIIKIKIILEIFFSI